nr:transposase family protein [Bacteroidota bacterium]
MDFMSDALIDGRRIRTLNIVEQYNRECLGIRVAHSITAKSVIEFLEQRIEIHGKPISIRTDNGPEFTSKAFQLWLHNKK